MGGSGRRAPHESAAWPDTARGGGCPRCGALAEPRHLGLAADRGPRTAHGRACADPPGDGGRLPDRAEIELGGRRMEAGGRVRGSIWSGSRGGGWAITAQPRQGGVCVGTVPRLSVLASSGVGRRRGSGRVLGAPETLGGGALLPWLRLRCPRSGGARQGGVPTPGGTGCIRDVLLVCGGAKGP